ncbi:MAG: hypothetical protein M1470_00480, partial [Bacteroidetes bacterium]|nr:hypothetical protein [Bacteroidota bacterium]MCL5739133.1 hypothetical protein [Bacteroidota bacterium]
MPTGKIRASKYTFGIAERQNCVVLKKVDTIIRIFFSLCYFLSFVESVDKLKTHAAYLAEGVW